MQYVSHVQEQLLGSNVNRADIDKYYQFFHKIA